MKKIFGITIIVLLTIMGTLGALELALTNDMAGAGKESTVIEREIVMMNDKNSEMSEKIASLSSVLRIREQAKSLGFVEKKQTIIIQKEAVAFAPQSVR